MTGPLWDPIRVVGTKTRAVALALGDLLRMDALVAGRLYDDVEQVPPRPVGLVLGCAPRLRNGRENSYFLARVSAAARLFRAGKVDGLLVSGRVTTRLDEPAALFEALVAKGVPPARIRQDRLGNRTIDSVKRARGVHGCDGVVLVSQRFHNVRALYLAAHLHLDAVGFNADEPRGLCRARMRLRELGARLRVLRDVWRNRCSG